jgi:formylmethanofuran dehydrogenase subunit E
MSSILGGHSHLSYMLGDNDTRRRHDIDSVTQMSEAMADNMANLGSQVTRLKAQVQDLSTTMTVMMRMLAESGALDATVLKYRVEAELEAIADARANPAAQTVKCITCNQVVPATNTVLTGDGTVCDACAVGVA